MTWDEYLPNVKTSWRTDLTDLPRLMSVTFVAMIGRHVPDSTCVFDKFLGRTGTQGWLCRSLRSWAFRIRKLERERALHGG